MQIARIRLSIWVVCAGTLFLEFELAPASGSGYVKPCVKPVAIKTQQLVVASGPAQLHIPQCNVQESVQGHDTRIL